MSAEPSISGRSGVAVALQYTIPELVEGKAGWYIAFYAYDPEIDRMRLKCIKVNRIKGIVNRRKYAPARNWRRRALILFSNSFILVLFLG